VRGVDSSVACFCLLVFLALDLLPILY
jgi:hypothetical protein